jgi:hypothetical protein
MRELYDSLRPNEARLLHWSAAAAAVALWFAAAWQDPLVLLAVPLIGGWFVFLVRRSRRIDPLGDDDDFF